MSCVTNFFFLGTSNDCLPSCPGDLYGDTLTGTCIGCTAPCRTCTVTSITCLSCITGNLLNNGCVNTCPDSFYALNNVC